MALAKRRILGIDPGLGHTGWGIVCQDGLRLNCAAYGCVTTASGQPLAERLLKIHEQIGAVIDHFHPDEASIETIWFGANALTAFGTGQARGAALVACAEASIPVGEYAPSQIKLATVGTGQADKDQVAYMVTQLLNLDETPHPDHAADALACAICHSTHEASTTYAALGGKVNP